MNLEYITINKDWPPKPIKDLLVTNPLSFLAGGACRDYYGNNVIYDYDIFNHAKNNFEVKDTINWRYKDRGIIQEYEHRFFSNITAQIIHYNFTATSVATILDSFDFTCCMWGYANGMLVTTKEAREQTLAKKLTIRNSNMDTQRVLERIIKFVKRGWDIDNKELYKAHTGYIKSDVKNKTRGILY